MTRPKYETENLLLSITKICETTDFEAADDKNVRNKSYLDENSLKKRSLIKIRKRLQWI